MQAASLYFGTTPTPPNGPHAGLIAIGTLAGFALLFGLAFYITIRQKKAMAAFAAKNGWQTLDGNDNTLAAYLPSYIRNNSQSTGHSYQRAYKAQVEGQDIIFFKYEDHIRSQTGFNNRFMTTTDNQSETQIESYAIAVFEVPQSFSPILLFHHSRLGNFGQHPDLQKFNLEGDFGKYFDVYAPQGSAPETLSVLTPDFMTFLIDQGQRPHWNIQINGNTVIVVGDAGLIAPSQISNLLNYIVALRQKLTAKPVINSNNVASVSAAETNSPTVPTRV